ncbi:S-layer family protein [Nostoc sp.]|uniref:S-layer family protein n=1 Tax=Nostoc sp. TaxID=1180 RepID=UPI002FF9566D
MTENLRSSCWLLRLMISLAISGAYVNAGDCAFAQITPDTIKPDTTLPDNSIVTRDPDGRTLNITGGTRYGSNLFHSFEQFSVLNGVYIDVGGASGDVQIQSNNLNLAQHSLIRADTKEAGGQVLVHTTKAVTLTEGSQITADVIPEGTETGGNVTIETGQLSIQGDNSRIRAGTFGKGRGGELIVRASEFVELIGKIGKIGKIGNGLFTETRSAGKGAGNAGNLTINTRRLIVQDGAQVSTSTSGEGQGGNLFVTDSDLVELQGTGISSIYGQRFPSALLTQTDRGGNAGNLTIKTRQLIVGDGAQIASGSTDQGNAGEIKVNASDAVNIFGVSIDGRASGFFSRTNKHGQGGDIIIDTNAFRVADNGVVDARTLGDKNAIAGNITVNTNTLEAVNGGQILTNAFTGSMGNAGNITVNATGRVTISGSAPSKRFVRGINGDLVEDESANSGLFVRSKGSGSAGNIEVGSPLISLDRGGEITAETASGNGGNITLKDLDLLLLLNGKNQISATAGINQQGGNGGNIRINAPNGFIVAKPNENNHIAANAYTGNGGRVYITAKSIFGIQNRKSNPPQSDITASSQFGLNGTVQINTPGIDPSSGLVNLPTVPVDTKLAQTCTAGSTVAKSSFTITGRGGLPPNPGDALNTDAVQVDLVTLNPEVGKPSTPAVSTNPINPTPVRIVEATGWVTAANGDVILTSSAPIVTPHSSWQSPADCRLLNQHQGG